jgi:hypothetical protein
VCTKSHLSRRRFVFKTRARAANSGHTDHSKPPCLGILEKRNHKANAGCTSPDYRGSSRWHLQNRRVNTHSRFHRGGHVGCKTAVMADGFARGRPPLAPGGAVSSASSVSDIGLRGDGRRFRESTAGAGAGSTALNASHGAPYEPNPEINTPLQQQTSSSSRNLQQQHSRQQVTQQWQPDFNSVGSLRRPSESSDDSDLHSHTLAGGAQQYHHQSQRSHHDFQQAGDIGGGGGGLHGSFGGGGLKHASSAAPAFHGNAVLDDIALPTVDSILSNTTHLGAGHDGSSANFATNWLPHEYGGHLQPLAQPSTTTRSSYQPTFADYNISQQQSINMGRAAAAAAAAHSNNGALFPAGTSDGRGEALGTVAGLPVGILNSIAASPSLVSALHALQKRCRRLEEENFALREHVHKEATAHAGFRGACVCGGAVRCAALLRSAGSGCRP